MTDHKTGMLDDIGPEPEAQAPAAEAPQIESEGQEATLEAEARTEGDGKPKPSEARPDGYVTKGERDRIAAELQQERQQRALYEDRFNKVIERFFSQQEQKADDAAPEYDLGPDPSVDPMGALEWAREQRRAEIERQREYQQQTQQQQEAHRQWQEAYTSVLTQFEEAKGAEPELQGLYDGLRQSYAREYQAYGYPMPQIVQLVERQEAQIIQWAHANRIPIGQAIKSLAASRGVQAQAPAPTEQRPTPERDPQTGQFQPADPDKAARQRESQERNASLSSAPGAPVKKMTAKELAAMPEDEMWRMFENVGRKSGSKQFDREMGFR